MDKSESIKELAIAMNKAQGQMGGAHKGADNPFFKSKYADLSAVVQAVKEPFANNGLSYVQFPIEEGGRIGVETILMHVSGEWLSNKFTVQLTKQDAQGAGSAITYCRRYGLQAVAGIPSDDDDGNNAAKANVKPKIPKGLQDMVDGIRSAIADNNMQMVGDLFRSFDDINEQVIVKNQFGSRDRTAIAKFMKSSDFIDNDVKRQRYAKDSEIKPLCDYYGIN